MKKNRHYKVGKRFDFKIFFLIFFSILFTFSFYSQDVLAQEVIYDNGAPNNFLGVQIGPTVIGADDFVLDNQSSITDVHFWIVDNPEIFDNQADYFFYSNNAGFPGAEIASGQGQNVQTTLVVLNECDSGLLFTTCFEVSMDLESPVLLEGDTIYWVGLRMPSATGDPSFLGLMYSDDNAGGFDLAQSTNGINWGNTNRDTLPFRLTGIPTETPQADLLILKSSLPNPVPAGGSIVYTITVVNNGPTDAQNVVVTDILPAGVTFAQTGGCLEDPNGIPTCSLGNIPSGEFSLYALAVNVNEETTGTLINLAQVTSDTNDSNPNNNSVIEETTVFADPPDTFFNEIVSIFQTFSIQVIKPIMPEPFDQMVSIVQDFSVLVFSAVNPPPFDQLVSIVQDFSIQVFSAVNPPPFDQLVSIVQDFSIQVFSAHRPAFAQSLTINQDFTVEVIEAQTIEQLVENIETADLAPGTTNALLATLKNIESIFTPLEFSATSLVTSSSKSSTDEANSKDQINEVCGKLGAFINKVNALTGKKINPEDAASFIATAEGIKETFGCN